MLNRVEYATQIGCDYIVLKNINGFEYDNGFLNTENDQYNLNVNIIDLANSYGIEVGVYSEEVIYNNLDFYADFIF